ncbi:hypothetical protein CDAR_480961 [Caerostris darwini]|uniref:Uncharacterized protein n=1 Tax=Caerostris darwini TaxID=1538125 RepID=A0AAV4W7P1_9ARAC|nr:hypothetical protein CDAR_480961 [Caerostris darwini]
MANFTLQQSTSIICSNHPLNPTQKNSAFNWKQLNLPLTPSSATANLSRPLPGFKGGNLPPSPTRGALVSCQPSLGASCRTLFSGGAGGGQLCASSWILNGRGFAFWVAPPLEWLLCAKTLCLRKGRQVRLPLEVKRFVSKVKSIKRMKVLLTRIQ